MNYIVTGPDGKEIKRYKTAAGAEKAAKVIEGAKVVYPSVDEKAELPEPNEVTDPEEKTVNLKKYKVLVRINIRSGPSLDAVKVGTVPEGTILEAYEDLGDWLKIRWKDGTAYARHKNHEYAVPVEIFEEKPFKAK